jgi:FSR family fosmidomycin resistance protein-like MFS transporter
MVAGALALAALLALVLAAGHLPDWSVLPLMAAFGFCTGLAGPSRDLMVRQAATSRFGEAAYGRVYGFVYSGLDAGISLAPLIFGGFMDGGRFGTVLAGVALVQTLAILTALGLGKQPAVMDNRHP